MVLRVEYGRPVTEMEAWADGRVPDDTYDLASPAEYPGCMEYPQAMAPRNEAGDEISLVWVFAQIDTPEGDLRSDRAGR